MRDVLGRHSLITFIRSYSDSVPVILQSFKNRVIFSQRRVSISLPVRKAAALTGVLSHRVSLEGLDRSVLTQLTHMDAHVCAAGGKRVVALPVYVQSRCCWEAETELRGDKMT